MLRPYTTTSKVWESCHSTPSTAPSERMSAICPWVFWGSLLCGTPYHLPLRSHQPKCYKSCVGKPLLLVRTLRSAAIASRVGLPAPNSYPEPWAYSAQDEQASANLRLVFPNRSGLFLYRASKHGPRNLTTYHAMTIVHYVHDVKS